MLVEVKLEKIFLQFLFLMLFDFQKQKLRLDKLNCDCKGLKDYGRKKVIVAFPLGLNCAPSN